MRPYYQDELVTLYHGDCREVLPILGDNCADLVLTDPPFSVPVKYHDSEGRYSRSYGDLLIMAPFFRDVFKALVRVTRRTGQVYIHCDADTYPIFYQVGYPLWHASQLIVWYKPTGRRGLGWKHSHELILHFRTRDTEYSDSFQQDVIGIMPVRTLNREHPAEKPGELLAFLADAVPPSIDPVVLDPFAGSGTTLASAKRIGRKAIGVEVDESYCEIAARRLAQGTLADLFTSEASA